MSIIWIVAIANMWFIVRKSISSSSFSDSFAALLDASITDAKTFMRRIYRGESNEFFAFLGGYRKRRGATILSECMPSMKLVLALREILDIGTMIIELIAINVIHLVSMSAWPDKEKCYESIYSEVLFPYIDYAVPAMIYSVLQFPSCGRENFSFLRYGVSLKLFHS